MDRAAVFIDVGYALHSVAELLTGSPDRSRVQCSFGAFVRDLVAEVSQETALPLLRIYWYDASLSGLPERDQVTVADLPGVQVRLGRLVRGEQKGVDSRIVRDLICLSMSRAIADAVLVAGDEDLCEGVQEAQGHGVRVTLLGVPGVNQSRLLLQQVDENRELSDEFWKRHFKVVCPTTEEPQPAPAPDEPMEARGPVNPVMAASLAAALERSPDSPLRSLMTAPVSEDDAFRRTAREAGAAFARRFLAAATKMEIQKLLALTGWQIPSELDRRLLRSADAALNGRLPERPELKPTVRDGFWTALRADGPVVISGREGRR